MIQYFVLHHPHTKRSQKSMNSTSPSLHFDENCKWWKHAYRCSLESNRLSGGYLPRGREVFWPITLNHTLIYAVMKDHHKKASELISLEMKDREMDRARGREIGGHLLTFLRAGSIKGSTPVICSSLHIRLPRDMSWHAGWISWDSASSCPGIHTMQVQVAACCACARHEQIYITSNEVPCGRILTEILFC